MAQFLIPRHPDRFSVSFRVDLANPETNYIRKTNVFGKIDGSRHMMAEKAAIVTGSYTGDNSVCCVARQHGLSLTKLFT